MPKKIELTKLQKEILSFFGKSDFGKNFYWTGGTLLSYFYLSHRISIDLDFFSNDLFADDQYIEFINNLKKEIKADKITQNLQHNRRIYFIGKEKENVKIELVFFPFPCLEKRIRIKEFNVLADSLTDIMANKTLSTYQRNEVKDIYDIYWYLGGKPKHNLLKLINLVEKKFGIGIEKTVFLEKANELCDNLSRLKPFLADFDKKVGEKAKKFFQDIFNNIIRKQIR